MCCEIPWLDPVISTTKDLTVWKSEQTCNTQYVNIISAELTLNEPRKGHWDLRRSLHSTANRGMQSSSQGTLGPCQSGNTNLLMRNPNLIVSYSMVFCWPFKASRKCSKSPYWWSSALPLSSITCCPAQGCNMCMVSAKDLRNDASRKFWEGHFSLCQKVWVWKSHSLDKKRFQPYSSNVTFQTILGPSSIILISGLIKT